MDDQKCVQAQDPGGPLNVPKKRRIPKGAPRSLIWRPTALAGAAAELASYWLIQAIFVAWTFARWNKERILLAGAISVGSGMVLFVVRWWQLSKR